MQKHHTGEDEPQRGPASNPTGRSSADRVRDTLALVTVIGFVAVTAILAIVFPLFALAPPNDMIQYLKDVSLIYSGIVGLIIGYYFGKH